MLSCGFEHCIALINGQPWSWGYGGSGCLGHGAYETITQPKMIEGIKDKVTYLESGGYHNSAITKTRKVYMWGRGDVGQLGLNESLLIKDEMGQVCLKPTELKVEESITQVSLGDAHTLLLTSQA